MSRALVLIALAACVVGSFASPSQVAPVNGGFPSLEFPVNGGMPSLDEEAIRAFLSQGEVPVTVPNGTEPWPPGTLPPLDYTPTPFDPRPDHVIGGLNLTSGVTGFDVNRARRFLYHSYSAYCSVSSLQAFNCAMCHKAGSNVQVIGVLNANHATLQAYVAVDRNTNEIIVAFRGTANLENWLANIKVWKASDPFLNIPNAKVATGFNEDHVALRPLVVAAVKRARGLYPSASVVVTGHSLGGALAAMQALHFIKIEGINVADVFTFGSPRIGNHDFALAYARAIPRTFRMSNNRDIVPHVPPMAFNFIHYDQEIWQTGSSYKECGRGSEDPKCANSVLLPTSIYDHTHYMQYERAC